MSTYKLTYFDMRGRAECSRLLFTYAGVGFEDVRLTGDQWGALKPCKLYFFFTIQLIRGEGGISIVGLDEEGLKIKFC